MPTWSKSSSVCVLKPQRGKEKVSGRLLGRRRGKVEQGQQLDSSVLPTGDKYPPPLLHTPDPKHMYSMYMIWSCTNTCAILRLYDKRGLHSPQILSSTCTFHTCIHLNIALNVVRMACVQQWLCGKSAWLSSEFTWLSKVVNPKRQGQRGS